MKLKPLQTLTQYDENGLLIPLAQFMTSGRAMKDRYYYELDVLQTKAKAIIKDLSNETSTLGIKELQRELRLTYRNIHALSKLLNI